MWASVLLFSVLGSLPNQASSLQLNNVRVTTGPFGSTRADGTPDMLPGDVFYVNYDIENLAMDATTGQVQYSMTFELTNAAGKSIFKDGPRDGKATLSLGGGRMPAFAHSEIGKDTEPGDYTLKISVTDLGNKAKPTQSIEKKFKVKKPEFGIVRPHLTFVGNKEAFLVAPIGAVGQTLVANCVLANVGKDPTTKQPNVEVAIHILDGAGKETIKPAAQTFDKGVPADQDWIDISFPVDLNRPGKFTIEVEATDKVSKKKDKVSFPITVYELK
jgi:hypothetical protein